MRLQQMNVWREEQEGRGPAGEMRLGDVRALLPGLIERYAGQVQVIYLDPPFRTGQTFVMRVRVGEKEWKSGAGTLTQTAYADDMEFGAYMALMRETLAGAKQLLSDTGVIYLHIDYHMHPHLRLLMDEIFGSPAPEEDEEDEEEQAMEAEAAPAPPRPIVPEEREDVRVYEPGKEKRDHEPIPILTEEKNPELAPIVPNRQPIQYSRDPERSRAIAADVRKRRTRPIGVVLILCGLLIIAALIANYFLQNVKWLDEGRGRSVEVLEADPDAITAEDAFISAEELQRQEEEAAAAARQSYYQVFQEDISWTSAKNSCNNLGGQLAVINNSDEFTMVTQLAQQSGVQGVWVGCHREGGFLVWESTEPVGVMTWADQEPSYTDSRDGAAEDYIMLWNTGNGWAYIDCRNDPVIADGERYAGKIGYVCEFES